MGRRQGKSVSSQIAELEPQFLKFKGRGVLRGDIAKDDSGSDAVSIHGARFVSITDVSARQPGCEGQAADEVSTYTQVKMEDAPIVWRIPKSECPDIWKRLSRHKWPKILVQYGRPSRSS